MVTQSVPSHSHTHFYDCYIIMCVCVCACFFLSSSFIHHGAVSLMMCKQTLSINREKIKFSHSSFDDMQANTVHKQRKNKVFSFLL